MVVVGIIQWRALTTEVEEVFKSKIEEKNRKAELVRLNKLKMEQIPEDTKDPILIKKRKQMKKKLPKRRTTVQYWGETQFTHLPTNFQ